MIMPLRNDSVFAGRERLGDSVVFLPLTSRLLGNLALRYTVKSALRLQSMRPHLHSKGQGQHICHGDS